MSGIVRLSLALLFALMMVIATASAALAFAPPGESGLDGFGFPAAGVGVGPDANGTDGGFRPGPWNATKAGSADCVPAADVTNPNPIGPIEFSAGQDCPPAP